MLKDRGNKKWTSLMLPEHVEELKKLWEDYEKEPMPVLDEQELEEMNRICVTACKQKQKVRVTVYQDGNRKTREGRIIKLNGQQQTIHFEKAQGTEKLPIQRLLHIEPAAD
ncbi:YolD-like family protein [Virgibacillus sp. MSP4-1]|uniref:YolD-like family protein n=1 Tax=Virgibacillus sp. MSP4-1 TaxID=2700081 RepID=UPI0003A85AD4|nr:YolD-like family protein [Virgibacillus sp. MSP4-1]QHS22528.1 YolD-like family protein [Virgibacillus sp. MSP4-1]